MPIEKYSNKNRIYFIATAFTESYMTIVFNLNFDDVVVSKYRKVQIIYQIDETITKAKRESVELINGDDALKIKYSLSGYKKNFKIIRNLHLDFCKGVKKSNCNSNANFQIVDLSLKGDGILIEPVLSYDETSVSYQIAVQVADYLIETQNKETGGWPIKITSKYDMYKGFKLNYNWHSAMAQGHALSLFSRLYLITKNEAYLKSGLNAVKVFDKHVSENGVKTYFLNKFVWYEEYPTQPKSVFVLNGFIYSLFGLYDFSSCLKNIQNENYGMVHKLYRDGIESLKTLLPIYDTGSRSVYDLRHISNFENYELNIARWDYHMVHINQLLHLSTFENEIIFKIITDRWIGYTIGDWCDHN